VIWLVLAVGLLVGIGIGRWYGWAKYRYPEFQEMLRVRVAKLRVERARYEAEEERLRAEINETLDTRIGL
jgi:hypothetical protein